MTEHESVRTSLFVIPTFTVMAKGDACKHKLKLLFKSPLGTAHLLKKVHAFA